MEKLADLQIVEIQKGCVLCVCKLCDLQIVEIQKGLSRTSYSKRYRNLQIVEIQKGLSPLQSVKR